MRRPSIAGGLPRRSPLVWGLTALLTLACWGALLGGVFSARSGVGLMFAGGWTLSLLPVHSARFRPRPIRRRPVRPGQAAGAEATAVDAAEAEPGPG
ncbi:MULTISPECIES: hypothetical protein [Streptacidiphilus]|uniref:Uncharacterized protein n=1 Tax=Streptacidiphilus cavernicola TaxID=3342716 RepID=A0ABV6UWJ0_9ACTN|nr:hypothetical protein [Streptacidiphilus jeojiense]